MCGGGGGYGKEVLSKNMQWPTKHVLKVSGHVNLAMYPMTREYHACMAIV